MKYVSLSISLVIILSFFSCTDTISSMDMIKESSCKTCDDFTDSRAVIEVCDNGDNTVTRTVTISGASVYSDVLEIDSAVDFSELPCSDFEYINF